MGEKEVINNPKPREDIFLRGKPKKDIMSMAALVEKAHKMEYSLIAFEIIATSLRSYLRDKPAEQKKLNASADTLKKFMDGDNKAYPYVRDKAQEAGIADKAMEYGLKRQLDATQKLLGIKNVPVIPKKLVQ